MSDNFPNDPAEIQARLGGPVGVWNEKGKVVLKAAMPDGAPVKLTPQEARHLAEKLEIFADQADRRP